MRRHLLAFFIFGTNKSSFGPPSVMDSNSDFQTKRSNPLFTLRCFPSTNNWCIVDMLEKAGCSLKFVEKFLKLKSRHLETQLRGKRTKSSTTKWGKIEELYTGFQQKKVSAYFQIY